MPTLSIESNGLLEKTAVYFNGQQIGGIKNLFLHLSEDGDFEALLQYTGADNKVYSKNVFSDYMENIRITEPSFTDEEAENMTLLTVESEGDIEDTQVFINDEIQDGITELFVNIKAPVFENKSKLGGFFGKQQLTEQATFKAEITYRYDDDSLETEQIF